MLTILLGKIVIVKKNEPQEKIFGWEDLVPTSEINLKIISSINGHRQFFRLFAQFLALKLHCIAQKFCS